METNLIRYVEAPYDLAPASVLLLISKDRLYDILQRNRSLFPKRWRIAIHPVTKKRRRYQVLYASEICAIREMLFRGEGRNRHYFGAPVVPGTAYRGRVPVLTGAVPVSHLSRVWNPGATGAAPDGGGEGLGSGAQGK